MSQLESVAAELIAPNEEETSFKLEVVVIPVSDVDRAKRFYDRLGWRLDADFVVGDAFRVVQFTPPGSPCSIHFGTGLTSAMPGSAPGHYLVVSDVEAARAELVGLGVNVSEVFHRSGPGQPPVKGPHPTRSSYSTYAKFNDPDNNEWLLQEVTVRLAGRIDPEALSFASVSDLSDAMRRASVAHGKYETRMGGKRDEDWPRWYAEYMAAERGGVEVPT